ncbi:MAG: metal-dependent hydrolase [Saprospiraceae bacterium]|nr:metal-dependent hydrolase [Saprospiraceae bacterium]MDW8484160.1 metal-dependent hydrolase [Saprospiraceae bacterium]
MKITYLGHSCFTVAVGGKHLLFDPFVSGNPLATNVRIEDIRCDYVLLTHAHSDHIADVETVMKVNPEAMIISIWEIYAYYSAKGYKAHPMNKGGWYTFDFGRVKMVDAVHSSSFPDGAYGGEAVGFVLDTAEGALYVAGDTALTTDMQLIPKICPPLKAAILPIGSNFTMDYCDAVLASDFLECNRIIGCHFDTFGFIRIDHEKAKAAFAEKGKHLHLPAIGETIEI